MTTSSPLAVAAEAMPGPRAKIRLRAHLWSAYVSVAFLILAVIVAIFAPLLAPYNANAIDPLLAFSRPSAEHLLGTDALGRDLLSRLIAGTRSAVLAPLVIVVPAVAVGTALALLCAWFGGAVDALISRAMDMVFAFPAILLSLVAAAFFGTSLSVAVVALSIAFVPFPARVLRTVAVSLRAQPFVEACTVQAFGAARVCFRHLLPNMVPAIITQATVLFGYAMVALASVSFLGLGVQAPDADWGRMVSDGLRGVFIGHPEEALFSSAAIVAVVLAVTVLGDRLAGRMERQSVL